jgi:hypothetical protein
MHPRVYALIGGIVMLAVGVLSLIPSLVGTQATLPALTLDTSYGLFLNLFPMNIVNKVVLILFGAAGIYASRASGRSLPMSILWSRVVFVVMGIAAIAGLFETTDTVYGYWPLFGNEVWAHGIFALLGAYFGFTLTSKVPDMVPRQMRNGHEHLASVTR